MYIKYSIASDHATQLWSLCGTICSSSLHNILVDCTA